MAVEVSCKSLAHRGQLQASRIVGWAIHLTSGLHPTHHVGSKECSSRSWEMRTRREVLESAQHDLGKIDGGNTNLASLSMRKFCERSAARLAAGEEPRTSLALK